MKQFKIMTGGWERRESRGTRGNTSQVKAVDMYDEFREEGVNAPRTGKFKILLERNMTFEDEPQRM